MSEKSDKKPGLLDLAKKAIIKAERILTGGAASSRAIGPDEPVKVKLPEPSAPSATASEAPPVAATGVPTSPSGALAPHAPRELSAEPAPPAPPGEPIGMLDLEEPPETYGVDEIAVFPRDPGWLFLYWEITGNGWQRARAALGGDGALVARLYAERPHPEHAPDLVWRDEPLGWDHGRRYLPAPAAGVFVWAELGVRAADGRFAAIARAPRVRVPPAEPSRETWVEWMEVPPAGSRGARLERPEPRARGAQPQFKGGLGPAALAPPFPGGHRPGSAPWSRRT